MRRKKKMAIPLKYAHDINWKNVKWDALVCPVANTSIGMPITEYFICPAMADSPNQLV